MALATLVKTGCNQYTIKTGNTNTTYQITVANVNGKITHTWQIVDNADVTILFSIDGLYEFTTDTSTLFFDVNVPYTHGGVGANTVTFTQLSQYLAPLYIGATININIVASVTLSCTYTLQSMDNNVSTLAQNIANAINALAISGYVASVINGDVTVNTNNTIITQATETITMTYAPFLWSVCNLFKCIKKLTNKIFCTPRGKCKEYVEKMRKERNELNRIMILYNQFSMMDDNERWDYLTATENTDILNDIFDKLNPITRRCGKCCKEHMHRHHHDFHNDPKLEMELPYSDEEDDDISEEPCVNCEERFHHEKERCEEEVTETITVTGNGNVTLIS